MIWFHDIQSFLSSWWPCTLAASQHMKMDMHHFLSSFFSIIYHYPVTLLEPLLFGHNWSSIKQLAQNLSMPFLCSWNSCESVFLFGNDEHMNWSLRINVPKGKDVIILMDNRRWNLLPDDLVKDGFLIHAKDMIIIMQKYFPSKFWTNLKFIS